MNEIETNSPSAMSRRDFIKRAGGTLAGAAALGPAWSALGVPGGAEVAPTSRPSAPLAMWALTGKLPNDEVCRQLDLFHQAGWGVTLYPRWGLEVDYLSAAWFDRIRFIVEQAAERQMEVWLYDEYNWPSGQAKGHVATGGGRCQAQVLRIGADGRSEVVTLPDTAGLLDITATRRFLETTYEAYAKTVGEFFGTTVRAIFTDEPSLPYQHQRGLVAHQPRWTVRWSKVLAEALGGDFPQRLAAASDPADPALWQPYWAAFTDTFESQWVRPLSQWCAAHRLALTGHLAGETTLGATVNYNGSLFRHLAHFQLPGIDEINTRVNLDECEALTLASISRFPGRERMAEIYALGPPSMSLDTMKRMVDLTAASGVDRYVLAICPFDFRGSLQKREWFNTCGFQQPWFPEAARVYTDYVAEAAARARQAKPFPLEWPSDEELWAVAGPTPTRSAILKERTEQLVKAAREVLRDRLPRPRSAPAVSRKPLTAQWTFRPAGLNSLRIDGDSLVLHFVPPDAELSVQIQLVSALWINGTAVDLAQGSPDTSFDTSYTRLPVGSLLRAGANRIDVTMAEKEPLRFLPHLILWGAFAVNAQGAVVEPETDINLGDWRGQGYPHFSGVGCYTAALALDAPPRRLELDTGGYPVRVLWNGTDLGLRCWAPFTFDLTRVARAGRNTLEVRVTSTIGHLIDSRQSPPVGLLDAWI